MIPASFVRTVTLLPDGQHELVEYRHPEGWYCSYHVPLTLDPDSIERYRESCEMAVEDHLARVVKQ